MAQSRPRVKAKPVRFVRRSNFAVYTGSSGLFFLDEDSERFISGVESALDHVRAFRDEDPRFRFVDMEKLGLGISGKKIEFRRCEISDFFDLRHKKNLLWFS